MPTANTAPDAKQAGAGAPTYRLVSVERTEAPEGAAERNWYEYVLADERSTLKGQRPGTLKQVTQYARQLAADLSNRARGGAKPTWSRGRKPAAAVAAEKTNETD